MASHWTIQNVLHQIGAKLKGDPLPAPRYDPPAGTGELTRLFLGVESMRRHATDEGWQLTLAFKAGGFQLAGKDLPIPETNVKTLLRDHQPGVIAIQDKREWLCLTADRSRDPAVKFHNVDLLSRRSDVFSLTIVKDAQQDQDFHRQAAQEIGANAWVCYYHPRIVAHLAPYVRPEHLIRTYHSLDRNAVPEYQSERRGAILSGAVSRTAYPLRWELARRVHLLPDVTLLRHPGYHRRGAETPGYLQLLTRYKVSICTASKYGYALRKIVEATAAGCVVLTDLPEDEVLPEIDGNLARIHPHWPIRRIGNILQEIYATYDPERQRHFAERAKAFYDYRAQGLRLAEDVERLRGSYAV